MALCTFWRLPVTSQGSYSGNKRIVCVTVCDFGVFFCLDDVRVIMSSLFLLWWSHSCPITMFHCLLPELCLRHTEFTVRTLELLWTVFTQQDRLQILLPPFFPFLYWKVDNDLSETDRCSEKVEIKRQRRKAFLSRQPSLDLKSQTIPGYGKKIQNYIIISFLEIVVPEKWWFIKLFWFFYLVFSFSFWPFTEAGGQQWPQAH